MTPLFHACAAALGGCRDRRARGLVMMGSEKGGGGKWRAQRVPPSEFVSVESLAVAGLAARAALQGRILFQLFREQRLLTIGAEAIEPQIHLAERRVEPLEACHAVFHPGQIETAGQINQLISLAALHLLCPVILSTGIELTDQLLSCLRPVGQKALMPFGQPGLRHFTHSSPQKRVIKLGQYRETRGLSR